LPASDAPAVFSVAVTLPSAILSLAVMPLTVRGRAVMSALVLAVVLKL
jgi:hypothetical protein